MRAPFLQGILAQTQRAEVERHEDQVHDQLVGFILVGTSSCGYDLSGPVLNVWGLNTVRSLTTVHASV